MKFLDEYRDGPAVAACGRAILEAVSRPRTLMEICGGQTHSIVQHGLDKLLEGQVTLLHGPGCPVCVTPVEMIDKAIEITLTPSSILCSFGDMLRVPGSGRDLLHARSTGGDVRIVYSPLDTVKIARDNPRREVVFFAVGFETTAPATAMAVLQAEALGLKNFSMLVSHVRVPPALDLILSVPGRRVEGVLAAGHVCAVMGTREYAGIASRYGVPIVVTGFEPLDILQGILLCVRQLERGAAEVENPYARAVRPDGNPEARRRMEEVFEVCDRHWRGLGNIPHSGLRIRRERENFDAENRFGAVSGEERETGGCIAGLVLQGERKPLECPAFGCACTPEQPLGAPMVSSEGACATYYRYRRI